MNFVNYNEMQFRQGHLSFWEFSENLLHKSNIASFIWSNIKIWTPIRHFHICQNFKKRNFAVEKFKMMNFAPIWLLPQIKAGWGLRDLSPLVKYDIVTLFFKLILISWIEYALLRHNWVPWTRQFANASLRQMCKSFSAPENASLGQYFTWSMLHLAMLKISAKSVSRD